MSVPFYICLRPALVALQRCLSLLEYAIFLSLNAMNYCINASQIIVLSSPTQMAVEFLHDLNVPFFKVGSGDTNNFPYLEKTAKKGEDTYIHVNLLNRESNTNVYL